MTRILWINPVPFAAYDEPIGEELRREADPATRVDVCSLPPIAGVDGPQHLEWNALEAVVAGPTVGVVRWARRQGYDGVVIGCFYDPFLRAAREIAGPMAVTAPAEACLHIAATLGERISILVGRRKWIPEMHENVVKYGFADRLASFRELRLGVSEFQADPACTEQRIIDEAQRAVADDRADVVVLGCTIEFGFYKIAQEAIGVPVIDAITAPMRYVEFLASLRRHGWHTSPGLGYDPIPDLELSWIPEVVPNVSFDPRP